MRFGLIIVIFLTSFTSSLWAQTAVPDRRLTLVRDLLDRLPDTHIEPPPLEFPELGHGPLEERYSVLQPIKDYPVG